MNNQPNQSLRQENHSTKKAYHAPQLKHYGSVYELTQTSGSGSSDDGFGEQSYAS